MIVRLPAVFLALFLAACASPLIVVESATAVVSVPAEAVPAMAAMMAP